MTDIALLRSLGLMLIAAAALVLVTRRLRVPALVTYILAGLLLGPVSGLLTVSPTVDVIAETGIALLLFLVGLELSFEKIRDIGKVALLAGGSQVVLTAAGGYLIASLLGFEPVPSLFIAIALTFSSTVVVVKLLDQKREMLTLYGRIAVGIFLVQDLVVVLVLTILAGLGRQDTMELGSIVTGLGVAFGGMTLLLLGSIIAARHLLPRAMAWIASSHDGLFIWAICWCFLFVLVAEHLHLSVEIGAFLAGISIAQLPYNQDLRRRVNPLMNFFIAVFFVTLGLRLDLGAALGLWREAIILSLFVLLGKIVLFMFIITRLGHGRRTSFLTSVTVAQISEFSFIFATAGVAAGFIGSEVLSLIAMVGLITMAVSAYLILYNHQLYELVHRTGVLRAFGGRAQVDLEEKAALSDHIVVVGMNSLGRALVKKLYDEGHITLAIDTDPAKLAGLPGGTLLGNAEQLSVIEEAGLDRCRLLISALQIEDANKLLAYRARRRGVPVVVHAFDQSVVPELVELSADRLILSKHIGVQQIARRLRAEGVLGGGERKVG